MSETIALTEALRRVGLDGIAGDAPGTTVEWDGYPALYPMGHVAHARPHPDCGSQRVRINQHHVGGDVLIAWRARTSRGETFQIYVVVTDMIGADGTRHRNTLRLASAA